MVELELPCGGVEVRHVASDYRPLTRKEIVALLTVARNRRRRRNHFSQILSRLLQGVRGNTDPPPAMGPVAEKRNALSEYYCAHFRQGPTPEVVDQMLAIMNG